MHEQPLHDYRRRLADRICDVEDRERCIEAEAVADQAVARTFAIMGVDINNPKDVEEFRQGLRFGAKMQRAVDAGIIAAVVTFVGLAIAALALGIKTKLGG